MGVELTRRELWEWALTNSLAFNNKLRSSYPPKVRDKEEFMELFDRNQIDFEQPTKGELVVAVNGENVIGTEGGQVIFKFSPSGKLVQLVVWNEKIPT